VSDLQRVARDLAACLTEAARVADELDAAARRLEGRAEELTRAAARAPGVGRIAATLGDAAKNCRRAASGLREARDEGLAFARRLASGGSGAGGTGADRGIGTPDGPEPQDGRSAPRSDRYLEIGPLEPPAFTPGRNEDVLIGPAQGLQSSTGAPFQNVVTGAHNDPETKYLWTIDERGINIALEKTPFPTRRGFIVHTNLSTRAAFGGEAWFGSDNSVTINAGSGRFGANAGRTEAQWSAAAGYWRSLGYRVNQIPLGDR
jgi:hypothetical protein